MRIPSGVSRWVILHILYRVISEIKLTRKDILYLILFIAGPISSGVLVGSRMFSTYLPVGDDPGNWLKRALAFAGVTDPLWEETLLSYPPIFPLLTYVLGLLAGDIVTGLKIAAVLALMLIPLTTGFLAYSLTRRKEAAIIASFLSALLPSNYEMIWWGAYPNLLALAIIPIAIHYLLKIICYDLSRRTVVVFIITSAVISLTHHLTSATYATTLIASAMLLFFILKIREPRIYTLIFTSLIFQLAYLTYLLQTYY
ncbi:MAG TPA: hypothetical protein EYP20_06105, partial [Aigarchaeota archaeon]|nr:hypothetical protein [Aigarchaeota archaeon]